MLLHKGCCTLCSWVSSCLTQTLFTQPFTSAVYGNFPPVTLWPGCTNPGSVLRGRGGLWDTPFYSCTARKCFCRLEAKGLLHGRKHQALLGRQGKPWPHVTMCSRLLNPLPQQFMSTTSVMCCRNTVLYISRHFLYIPSVAAAHLLSFLRELCSCSVLTGLVIFLLKRPSTSTLPIRRRASWLC